MDNNTKELLEQLASKLGTTSEYLWGILIKQAPLTAAINVIWFLVSVLFVDAVYKLHIFFSKEIHTSSYTGDKESWYEKSDGVLYIVISVTAFFSILFLLLGLGSLENAIYGFFNPEYWALSQILKQLK